MNIWSDIWLVDLLPEDFLPLLGPFSLILIGYLVEKHYVPRVSMFANAAALVTYFYRFQNLPFLLILYINAATLLGFIGLASRMLEHSLSKDYYRVGKYFSSAITGLILLWGATAGLS